MLGEDTGPGVRGDLESSDGAVCREVSMADPGSSPSWWDWLEAVVDRRYVRWPDIPAVFWRGF